MPTAIVELQVFVSNLRASRAFSLAALLLATICLQAPPARAQAPTVANTCLPDIEPAQRPGSLRALVVLVDETTLYPQETAESAKAALRVLARPGTHITIIRFSTFAKDRSTQVVNRLTLEPDFEFPKKADDSMKRIAAIDKRNSEIRKCLAEQRKNLPETAWKEVEVIMKGASSNIQRSDILGTLKQVEAVAASRSERDKVILMLSDMLEHSDFLSFYQGGTLRQVDPQKELKSAEAQGLVAKLPSVRVFIVGGGLLPAERGPEVRSARAIKALEDFWTQYFERAGSKLVEFGKPNLLREPQ